MGCLAKRVGKAKLIKSCGPENGNVAGSLRKGYIREMQSVLAWVRQSLGGNTSGGAGRRERGNSTSEADIADNKIRPYGIRLGATSDP